MECRGQKNKQKQASARTVENNSDTPLLQNSANGHARKSKVPQNSATCKVPVAMTSKYHVHNLVNEKTFASVADQAKVNKKLFTCGTNRRTFTLLNG